MHRAVAITSSQLNLKTRFGHSGTQSFVSRPKSRMAKTVQEALNEGELFTDNIQYAFLKLPVSSVDKASTVFASCSSSSSAFRGLLVDKDEISMMIPQDDWQTHMMSMDNKVEDWEVGSCSYRLITFDVVMDPNLIGFMYNVTKVLAAENISVLPFAAYSRDHIFVQEKDYEDAIAALERLKNDVIRMT